MPLQSVVCRTVLIIFVALLSHNQAVVTGHYFPINSSSQLSITANPSAVVIKVGDKASINLTVSGGSSAGSVCFGEEGFPSSGFNLTFIPQCASIQQPAMIAQLIVEATPAAAPQNFTALVQATLGNQTASTPITVTVVPAIPAWIPWLGVLLFFLVIGAALFIRPRRPKDKGKK